MDDTIVHADEYRGAGGKAFKPFPGNGYRNLSVLPKLWGRPWDDDALAWVHSLRPTYIRVTTGGTHCDCRPWRVTVYVNDDNTIRKIHQEIQFGITSRDHWNKLQQDQEMR